LYARSIAPAQPVRRREEAAFAGDQQRLRHERADAAGAAGLRIVMPLSAG